MHKGLYMQYLYLTAMYVMYEPVLCDELYHKFIHRRERGKFASSMYPLQCLGNDFENI